MPSSDRLHAGSWIAKFVGAVLIAVVIGLTWTFLLSASAVDTSLVSGTARAATLSSVSLGDHSAVRLESPASVPAPAPLMNGQDVESLGITTSLATSLLAPVSITVTAYDVTGSVAISYTGAVSLTSSDPRATLPDVYTYTAEDQGTHVFADAVAFRTSGQQWLSVRDTVSPSLAVTVTPCVTMKVRQLCSRD